MAEQAKATGKPRGQSRFGMQVLAGMAIGLALGFVARGMGAAPDGSPNGLATALDLVGASFVQLLKVLVPPLVFAAIVASIGRLRQMHNAARLAGQTLVWFAITALIAVSIGLTLGTVLQPGLHSGATPASARVPDDVGSWLDFIKGLVPSNFLGLAVSTTVKGDTVKSAVSFNVLQIVVLALGFGAAALKAGEAGERFLAGCDTVSAVLRRLLSMVVRLAPIGSAGLIGNAVVRYGWETLSGLGRLALAVYLGLGLVLFVVYPLLLRLHGLAVRSYFAKAWPAIELAFVSRSSIAALPVAESIAERQLGVPRSYAAFAVPVGATTKMDGCAAIYPAIAALFVAQFYNLALGPTDYALIVLVSVLGSAATAGVTGAVVMLTLTLSTLGLPLEGAGLLLAIDPILDMGRTAVNVAGQILIPVIVARREGILNPAIYDAPASADATGVEETVGA